MTETTLLYALSTLAQTCAALAAFVGAVGLFRLQLVREALSSAQRNLRATAADAGIVARGLEFFQPLRDIVKAVEERCATRREDDPWHVLKAGEDLARWRRALKRFQLSYVWLVVFEIWNLLVIGASLAAFNYIPPLVCSPWTFWGLWIATVGTVIVTLFAVFAWTRG